MINTLDQILKIQDENTGGQRVALIDQEKILTYQEVDNLSTCIAKNLISEHGVSANDRVAICLPKSWQAIIALVAVLKARASYVILDPKSPNSSKQKIIQSAQIKYVINEFKFFDFTSREFSFDLPEVLESDESYIYFTSGSTGNFKGACFNHQKALCFIKWAAAYFQFRAEDKVACVSELTFDVCLLDIFVTWYCGGSVVLVPDKIKLFSKNLSDYINLHRVTALQLVPTLWENIAKYKFSHLKKLIFTGQAINKVQFESLKHHQFQIYNLYGQTEANSYLCYEIKNELDYPPPIAELPLPNYVCIKDQHLWIKDHSLMLKYLGESEIREYNTKDLVEIKNNKLYLIGRADNMLKIKGHRVYPEMIEANLNNIVSASCVFYDEELNQLVAVVEISSSDNKKDTHEKLLKYCSENLHIVHIPQKFYFVENLPQNKNGKIERNLIRAKFSVQQNE
jgi:D-alanine--poly(phosphoribitol) ligase subunit 1